MSKVNSLENINLQFRTIMGNMGLDEEKQNRLTVKMDLSRKIKTIISMQTLEERKKKIQEYLERIGQANSLMSILSLHCSIENGNKTLFSIFMNSKGPETILKSMEKMEGEFVIAVLDFVFMLLEKYDCEIPNLLETVLRKYLELKFRCPSFFKILEHCAGRKDYEILFVNTSSFGCICSSYFSLLVGSNKEEDLKGLIEILKKTERVEYVEYVLFVHGWGKKETSLTPHKCNSERIFEIIRIAEEKKMLDLVTNIVESFVFGKPLVDLTEHQIKKCSIKEETPKEVEVKEEVVPPQPSPVVSPNPAPRKKIIKKIVKKAKPEKNFLQIKWTKTSKKGTIFEKVGSFEISEKELEPFEKVPIKIDKVQKVPVKSVETLFPEKKNYALNIVLSRVKLTDKDLKDKILNLDTDCDPILVKQLLVYFPTEEEIEALAEVCPGTNRAEAFFKECLPEMNQLKDSLNILNFKGLLEDLLILDQLNILSQYYSRIINSSSLRNILGFLLTLGNLLNKGTFLGQAEAFSFDSIPVFLETKPVLGLIKRKVDLSSFLEEFKILFDVQRLSFENIKSDFHELTTNFRKIGNPQPDLGEKYKSIETKYQMVLELYNQAREYLSEKIDESFNRQFLEIYLRLKSTVE